MRHSEGATHSSRRVGQDGRSAIPGRGNDMCKGPGATIGEDLVSLVVWQALHGDVEGQGLARTQPPRERT